MTINGATLKSSRNVRLRFAALVMAATALLVITACGDDGDDRATGPTTTEGSTTSTTTSTTSPPAAAGVETTAPRPGGRGGPAGEGTTGSGSTDESHPEELVASGDGPGGHYDLLARREADGTVCARLRVDGSDRQQVCNEASEQDSNGNSVLRYAGSGPDPNFIIAIGTPPVAKVSAQPLEGPPIEEATVSASFTDARFAILLLPPSIGLGTLSAVGADGAILTTITVNR